MAARWAGVFPAVTTKFREDFSLDHEAMERHFAAQIVAGVHGLIVCGSLGESSTLAPEEKLDVLRLALRVSDGRVPVLCGIAEGATAGACRFAERAAALGADGFMLLPPMLYRSDRRETLTYLRAVADATDRPIMIYNNPVAYGVDVTPEMFEELADEPKFVALKESSDDVRRVTDIINRVGDRYRIFCGVDDLALEAMLLGADGWVAGLVCAFPRETVAIYRLAQAGRLEEARALYRWFMPLLHLDVSTKLVQNIKLAEAMTGLGTERVRPPRLPLAGEERARVKAVIEDRLSKRPPLPVLEAI
ncbi:dihydrodipicolinate synthase family protein [Rhodocaloribacter sp.]